MGTVARLKSNFTNKLNISGDPDTSTRVKEIWVGIEVAGTEIGNRTKVSDGTLVQLLLASDASIATYLTLVYEGEENPITTIYKDLPLSSLSSDGSESLLSNYFRAVTAGTSKGVTDPINAPGDVVNWREGSNVSAYYNAGNVGIGVTDPDANLDISGGSNKLGILRVVQRVSGAAAYGLDIGLDPTDGDPVFSRIVNDVVTEAMRFDRATGKVGIGVADPDANLDISGGTNKLGILRVVQRVSGAAAYGLDIGLDPTDGDPVFSRIVNDVVTEAMRFDRATGNVGIGTTNPTYTLTVNGTIRAKEIIVDTGWSDFVFEDNYRLRPLREVEQFISANKHLPGIPTEAEVKEKGVTLGNISSKLLQKIEELTLYLIDLKKENNSLKAKLAVIERQLNDHHN